MHLYISVNSVFHVYACACMCVYTRACVCLSVLLIPFLFVCSNWKNYTIERRRKRRTRSHVGALKRVMYIPPFSSLSSPFLAFSNHIPNQQTSKQADKQDLNKHARTHARARTHTHVHTHALHTLADTHKSHTYTHTYTCACALSL